MFSYPSPGWCVFLTVFVKTTKLTNYCWMLCEGLYLYKLIVYAFKEQTRTVSNPIHHFPIIINHGISFRSTFTSWVGYYLLLPWFLTFSLTGSFRNTMTNAGLSPWATGNGFITPYHSSACRSVDQCTNYVDLKISLTGQLPLVGKYFVRSLQKVALVTGSLQNSSSSHTYSSSSVWNPLHVLCFKGKNHGIMWFLLQFPIFPGCCRWLPSGYICINHFLLPQFWGEYYFSHYYLYTNEWWSWLVWISSRRNLF